MDIGVPLNVVVVLTPPCDRKYSSWLFAVLPLGTMSSSLRLMAAAPRRFLYCCLRQERATPRERCVVSVLLGAGAAVDKADNDGDTPSSVDCHHGHTAGLVH